VFDSDLLAVLLRAVMVNPPLHEVKLRQLKLTTGRSSPSLNYTQCAPSTPSPLFPPLYWSCASKGVLSRFANPPSYLLEGRLDSYPSLRFHLSLFQ
jgi:hypothetical protein